MIKLYMYDLFTIFLLHSVFSYPFIQNYVLHFSFLFFFSYSFLYHVLFFVFFLAHNLVADERKHEYRDNEAIMAKHFFFCIIGKTKRKAMKKRKKK